jgi:type IV secretory pathway VirJ component
VADFVARVGNGRLVSGEAEGDRGAVGGGRPDPLAALLQWLDPRIPNQVATEQGQSDTAGLPLTEVPAAKAGEPILAVMLSGDGGWAALDRAVTAELAAQGIGTVGWDSLSYYWKARTPEEVAPDLARLLRHYLQAWGKRQVLLIGYSFGADVLPFLVSRLPPDLRESVVLVVFLGLGPTASFEFHLTDWLSSSTSGDSLPVLPEVRRIAPLPRLCIYGDQERGSLCPGLRADGVAVRELPGDHHFGGDYAGVARLIVEALRAGQSEGP